MSVISTGTLFNYKRRGRWKTFLAGLAIDVVGVWLLVAVVPRFATEIPIKQVEGRHYVALVTPVDIQKPLIQPALIQPPPELAPSPRVATLREQPIAPPQEKVRTHEVSKEVSKQASAVEPKEIPPVQPHRPVSAMNVAPAVKPTPDVAKAAPPAEIKTSVFGGGKSETATVHQPARQVQTGGFGDPNGVPAQGAQNHSAVAVAAVGSFELPSGPGKGNGTGGSHGVAGTVQSAGFGNGAAGAAQGTHAAGGSIVAGGFGERVAQSGGGLQRVAAAPMVEPVEIVFKPRPDYTAEAIRRHIEGEVLLDVVFGATGSLHVNRVVKGLGYGLDDEALAVAQRIRFKPARKDGQPYDCAALVHIVFELTK
jgi:TonB family protein